MATVAEEGNFHLAARRLGYTQSAISQQIAILERAVGQALIHRASRGKPLALTAAGERLSRLRNTLEYAVATARQDIAAMAAGVSGVVRIGVPFPMPALSVPVVEMCNRNPHVTVEVVQGERLEDLVFAGSVDAAILRSAGEISGLEIVCQVACSYLCAVPSLSRLAAQTEGVTLSDLEAYPRIGTADGTAFTGDVPASIVAANAEMLLELVAAGGGVGIVPEILIRHRNTARLTTHPICDLLVPFRLTVVSLPGRPRSAEQLLELLRTELDRFRVK